MDKKCNKDCHKDFCECMKAVFGGKKRVIKDYVFKFGKYKGKKITEVAILDENYLIYLRKNWNIEQKNTKFYKSIKHYKQLLKISIKNDSNQ